MAKHAPQYQSFWPKNYKPSEEAGKTSGERLTPATRIRWKRFAGASGNVDWQEIRLWLERLKFIGCEPIWLEESTSEETQYRVALRRLVIEFRDEEKR